MSLPVQLIGALALDAVAGDPRWLPHPVKLIGKLSATLESLTRRLLPPKVAGIVTAAFTVAMAGAVTWAGIAAFSFLHPFLGELASTLVLWTTIASRDLADHAREVDRALRAEDLPCARRSLAKMVSRDTEGLEESAIVRGTIESVSENTMDGVTAPIFYACLFGPVGAIAYKAINTLDSMFGYRNERYLRFGWASARLDDCAGYIPARLTAPLISIGAGLLGLNSVNSFRIWFRDGQRHPSPNSGLAEAAVAGALDIQLGGVNRYFGQLSNKPTIGEPNLPLTRDKIIQSIRLMAVTTGLAVLTGLGLRWYMMG
jgi:adenosylcobinamide-phosphate synthase